MVAEVLRPNVQDLQQDVIELLGQISDLMSRASSNLSSDEPDNKYIDFEKQIRNETSKVENLELRMAIVAPMKAGKSTIVNAIAGQDILPSRNSAMTTLPTEIIFDGDLKQPILTLSCGVLSVFQDTLVALREKIKERGLETVRERLANYPHLQKYPKLIQELKVGESIPRKSEGRENIALTLTSLNDNEVFDVNLSLPQPNLASEDIEVSNPYIKRNTKYIDQGYKYIEKKKRKWWSLWLIPVTVKERVKKPDKEVKYFTVYLEDVISQVNDSLEKSIDDINSNIRDYIEDDFQQRINIFFNELNIYLTNYSDNLAQAQVDQKKKTEEKKQLIYQLNYLISESQDNIKDTNSYLEIIKELVEKN